MQAQKSADETKRVSVAQNKMGQSSKIADLASKINLAALGGGGGDCVTEANFV